MVRSRDLSLAIAGACALVLVCAGTAAAQSVGGAHKLTIEQIIDIKHPSQPIWSPDGKHVAFVWDQGGIENLYLAGDYTRTGWPATMEGAVRSGYLAADAVARNLIPGAAASTSFLVSDLAVQWPARLLGLGG